MRTEHVFSLVRNGCCLDGSFRHNADIGPACLFGQYLERKGCIPSSVRTDGAMLPSKASRGLRRWQGGQEESVFDQRLRMRCIKSAALGMVLTS